MLNKKPYKKDLNVAATTPFDRMKLLFGFSPGRKEKKYLAWDFFLKIKTSDPILGQPMAHRHLDDHYRQKKTEWLFIKKTAGEYHSLSLLDSDHPNYTNSIYYKGYLF